MSRLALAKWTKTALPYNHQLRFKSRQPTLLKLIRALRSKSGTSNGGSQKKKKAKGTPTEPVPRKHPKRHRSKKGKGPGAGMNIPKAEREKHAAAATAAAGSAPGADTSDVARMNRAARRPFISGRCQEREPEEKVIETMI
ncbi:hypothetical protein D9611_013310 [Ephemerocybe angulata]|uniref:Uncharacterized protein n=1 Tax=Ephemerocybe angulata TaxID=980116 RepID=A0A8H5FIW8_9AGAR|nr:hypothetical protein D9611_013310 [Tulosesus angulatus]